MNWIDAKAKYDQGSRLIKVGLDMIQESIEMMEKLNEANNTEIPICPIKEGKIECERRDVYNERPYVQLQPGDYSSLSQQLSEAWERHKHKGK